MKKLLITAILFSSIINCSEIEKNSETVNYKINESLLKSAELNDIEGVKEALSIGANINYQNSMGSTALGWAIFNNNTELADFLIKTKANLYVKEFIYLVQKEMLSLMIASGIDVNFNDRYKINALKIARLYGRDEVVNLLVKAGAIETKNIWGN